MSHLEQPLADSLLKLHQLIKTLRSPDGCPWDHKQTPKSLKKHILEEAYEVIDAIDGDDHQEICLELGDLLMQIFFLADIYDEQNLFSLYHVSEAIQEKLIRRHPHVFKPGPALSDEAIHQQWEQIKQQERQRNGHTQTNHRPAPLPALLASQKARQKHHNTPLPELEEFHGLIKQLFELTNQSTAERIIGKLLTHCVDLAEKHGLDAETCLRQYTADNHSD